MISTRIHNPEVLYPDEDVVLFSAEDIGELKRLALLNPRRRVRLCTHRSPDDALHEMIIVHTRETYVPPHKHSGKAEAFSIIEGEVDVVHFHDDGTIRQVIAMGSPSTAKPFYHRIDDPIYHSLLIRSEFLIFHEITQGPFRREDTLFAPWIPEGDDEAKRALLSSRVEAFLHPSA